MNTLHSIEIASTNIVRKVFPFLVRMLENTDQKNFEYGHFKRSE